MSALSFFARCPDCDGNLYPAGSDVNRHGQTMRLFRCDTATCDAEALADLDIYLEPNETWSLQPDESGRLALHIDTVPETTHCAECDAEIELDGETWFHVRIEDGSHNAEPVV